MVLKQKLGGADGVRALACLLVMAHHAFQRLSLPSQAPWLQDLQLYFLTGSSGVAVFFVLSGFLLSIPFWSAWCEGAPSPSLKTYAVRRWARIAPAFWLNLTVTFLLSTTVVPDAPELIHRFLAGFTFTSSLSWETFFPVELNGPLWSIGFEVFSYVVLGLLMGVWFLLPLKRTAGRGLIVWLIVWMLAVAGHAAFLTWGQTDAVGKGWQYGMYGGAKYWWPQYNPVGFFATFCIGTLAAGVCEAWRRASWNRFAAAWADTGAALALILAALLLWQVRAESDWAWSWPSQPYYFPTFSFLVGTVLALAPHGRWVPAVLDNPVFRYLATISFGLYIWHYLILEFARFFWHDLAYFGIQDPGVWALRIGILYGTSAVVATLSWYGFEQPLVKRFHGLRRSG